MPSPRHFSRREILQNTLIFSASLMMPRVVGAIAPASADALHFFCFGDWGAGTGANQAEVARAMQDHARTLPRPPQALFLLGDNFYGPLSGTDSPRWQKEFEEMYPAKVFPGPCHAILGNHDYDDQPGGEKIQMDYAKTPFTRWKMPARWYRLDLPLATILCVDTHYTKLSKEDIAAQQTWLEAQLAAPRTTPWLIVCGHHPVFSCGPHHGDSPWLRPWRELFEQTKVDAYLCGHEHDLQHLREKGRYTDWLVSGGGGQSLHPVAPNEKTTFATEKFGFLHLAIDSQKLSVRFIGTDAAPIYSYERQR